MTTKVYYVTDLQSPIATRTDRDERWYYGGSFVDGEKARILIFTGEIFIPGCESLSRTIYINLGKNFVFPLTLKLARNRIKVLGPDTDEGWRGLEVQVKD